MNVIQIVTIKTHSFHANLQNASQFSIYMLEQKKKDLENLI